MDISEHQEKSLFLRDSAEFEVLPRTTTSQPIRVMCWEGDCAEEMNVTQALDHAKVKHGLNRVLINTKELNLLPNLTEVDISKWEYK